MKLYEEGDDIIIDFECTDDLGAAVNPLSVYFALLPEGVSSEWVYSVQAGTITQVDATHFTFTVPSTGYPGEWAGRSWSTQGGAKPWGCKVNKTNLPMVPSTPTTVGPGTIASAFTAYQVTTTDATPTRLVRIPLAADQAVEIAISVFGVSGANAFERVGLAFYKRTGSAAPVLDTDAIAAGLTGVFGSSWGNAALTAATAAFAINTDSIDINVTGIAATTIRWSLQTGAWFYV